MGIRLRIDYLGSSMDLPAKAFAAEHQARGHEVKQRRTIADLPTIPPPDVVVHAPLDKTPAGLVSTCVLANHVVPTTLLVMMFNDVGNSHAMLALHARRGHCHPRLLLHWPGSIPRSPGAVVNEIEVAATRADRVSVTAPLPPGLLIDADQDLGEVMGAKERFASLLYIAASHHQWGSWGELTPLLRVGDGVVKNINSELGGVLKDARLVPPGTKWTSQRFARFVTEHRSFIIAYGSGHLGLEPPAVPFWLSHTA
ncbi:MAG: hypothetical protein GY724_07095 [Actinomycetia bacterium]|nr:hypothetical protein [Actinomycetes bacterium]